MSLPMHMFQPSLKSVLSTGTPSASHSKGAVGDFSRYADQINAEANAYADIDIKDIETRKVKVKTVDHFGNVKEEIKEMAVCPECGETNCPCIARVTVQARLDEENAKGVRNAEKPAALSIVPRSFNQMSLNLEKNVASAPRF